MSQAFTTQVILTPPAPLRVLAADFNGDGRRTSRS
jgi:hypothetical protein